MFLSQRGIILFRQLPEWLTPVVSSNRTHVACNKFACESFFEENSWNLELIGMQSEKRTHSEQLAVNKAVRELQKAAAGYMVKSSFCSTESPMTNICNAYIQLNSLLAKYEHDPKLFDQYDKVILEY